MADAVEAAGGRDGKADLSALNLARVLVDGEQVRVPAVGDPVAGHVTRHRWWRTGAGEREPVARRVRRSRSTPPTSQRSTPCPGWARCWPSASSTGAPTHGRFTSVDELGEVSGIGEKLLAQLSPLVTL